jgi:hypothetical protein
MAIIWLRNLLVAGACLTLASAETSADLQVSSPAGPPPPNAECAVSEAVLRHLNASDNQFGVLLALSNAFSDEELAPPSWSDWQSTNTGTQVPSSSSLELAPFDRLPAGNLAACALEAEAGWHALDTVGWIQTSDGEHPASSVTYGLLQFSTIYWSQAHQMAITAVNVSCQSFEVDPLACGSFASPRQVHYRVERSPDDDWSVTGIFRGSNQ